MVCISITAEAFEALASTIPFGSIGFEAKLNAEGERLIWIEEVWADKLSGLRGPGESYSDVILPIGFGVWPIWSTFLRRGGRGGCRGCRGCKDPRRRGNRWHFHKFSVSGQTSKSLITKRICND
jgi:hypothetical protein